VLSFAVRKIERESINCANISTVVLAGPHCAKPLRMAARLVGGKASALSRVITVERHNDEYATVVNFVGQLSGLRPVGVLMRQPVDT